MDVGKCPKCENFLTSEDIADVKFRGILYTHYAYICRICGHIIGFSAGRP